MSFSGSKFNEDTIGTPAISDSYIPTESHVSEFPGFITIKRGKLLEIQYQTIPYILAANEHSTKGRIFKKIQHYCPAMQLLFELPNETEHSFIL